VSDDSRDVALGGPAVRALGLSLLVGALVAILSLLAPLRASGGDTVPGRYGAAVFACRSSLDLREVDWMKSYDAADSLPYYAQRTREGAVASVFGPGPAWLGAPFMESLEPGTGFGDYELERRARHAAALALGFAATLLCAALSARMTPGAAAAMALVTGLSFAGVPTLGQGLWQQTVFVVPLMAAVATVAWASWREGALLALTPGLLFVAGLTRINDAVLVLAVGVTWVIAVRESARRLPVILVSVPLAFLFAFPQLAWNASQTSDPFGIGAYMAVHTTHGAGLHASPLWFLSSLLGLVASPARGLLFFAPTLLLALYVGLRYGHRGARVMAVGILLHIVPVAMYYNWWGGWVFGPRMLTETIWVAPLLVAPGSLSRLLRNGFFAAGAVTVAVGLLGTFRYQIGVWDLRRDPDQHHEALWDVVDSPLVDMIRGNAVPTIDSPQGPYAYCMGPEALQTLRRRTPSTPPSE
jgi:hypothetical protein